MAFALHAVILKTDRFPGAKVWFGKGAASVMAVQSRLMPEHSGAEVVLSEDLPDQRTVDFRHLLLTEQLKREMPRITTGWYPMQPHLAGLYLYAALRSGMDRVQFPSSAEGMRRFREALGVDQGVIAAMLSTDRSRVCRLEQGKGTFTYDDFRRLRYWAARMDALGHLHEAFPLSPKEEPTA